MLSLQACRKILGPSCTLSDSQLEEMRNGLCVLADIVIEASQIPPQANSDTIPGHKTATFEEMLDLLTEAEKETALERVAIMEHDGNLSRQEAESTLLTKMLEKHNARN